MGQLKDRSKEREELEAEIEKLEAPENPAVKPEFESPTFKEIEYTPASDEDIESSAKNSLEKYRQEGVKGINERNEREGAELSSSREATLKEMDERKAALSGSYDEAVRAVDNDAIKRGLARSSVAAVSRGELEAEYLNRNADIAETYGKKISDIDAEISALSGKLRTALDDFNLTYAVKLNEKIDELKAEREKKSTEITKYNNEIRAKRTDYEIKKAQAESKLYSEALAREKAELEARRDDIYKSVYKKMDEYLSSMTAVEARTELLNHTLFGDHLNSYYYNKLFDKYGRIKPKGV